MTFFPCIYHGAVIIISEIDSSIIRETFIESIYIFPRQHFPFFFSERSTYDIGECIDEDLEWFSILYGFLLFLSVGTFLYISDYLLRAACSW